MFNCIKIGLTGLNNRSPSKTQMIELACNKALEHYQKAELALRGGDLNAHDNHQNIADHYQQAHRTLKNGHGTEEVNHLNRAKTLESDL